MDASDLTTDEYGPFYQNYVSAVPSGQTLGAALEHSATLLTDYLSTLSEGRADYAYAAGKWTIKEALQHVIDTERIFAYRALRLGRGDATPLPGFEQNAYARAADVSRRSLADLTEEFRELRKLTVALFETVPEDMLGFTASASGHPMSCRAMGFIMAGHTYHHVHVYRDYYA